MFENPNELQREMNLMEAMLAIGAAIKRKRREDETIGSELIELLCKKEARWAADEIADILVKLERA